MEVISNEDLISRKYWDIDINQGPINVDENKAISTLQSLLINSVRERMRSYSPIGVEISGGLDSSAILAIASKLNNDFQVEINTFTHILDNELKDEFFPFDDELTRCKIILNHVGILNHYTISATNESIIKSLESGLRKLHGPVTELFSIYSDKLYERVCQEQTSILLSGFGGNEGVTYHAKDYIRELFYQKDWNSIKRLLNNNLRPRFLLQLRTYLRLFVIVRLPFIEKFYWLLFRRNHFLLTRFRASPIKNPLRNKYNIKSKYYSEIFPTFNSSIGHNQYRRINSNHITSRIENSANIAQSYRIIYRYPFLDVKLLEYYFSLPSNFKYQNNSSRYIFRKAIESFLPNDIVWNQNRVGATIPSIYYRLDSELEICRNIIKTSQKENRYHYIDYSKLTKMVDQLKDLAKGKKTNFGPKVFINSIAILILQKWQREGKIDIGIKC